MELYNLLTVILLLSVKLKSFLLSAELTVYWFNFPVHPRQI